MKSSNYTARWNKQDTKQEDKVWKNRYMGKYKFVTAQHISESYKLVTVIAFRESQPRGLTGRIHSSLPFHIVWILYHGVYYLANSLNLVKKKKKKKKKKVVQRPVWITATRWHWRCKRAMSWFQTKLTLDTLLGFGFFSELCSQIREGPDGAHVRWRCSLQIKSSPCFSMVLGIEPEWLFLLFHNEQITGSFPY